MLSFCVRIRGADQLLESNLVETLAIFATNIIALTYEFLLRSEQNRLRMMSEKADFHKTHLRLSNGRTSQKTLIPSVHLASMDYHLWECRDGHNRTLTKDATSFERDFIS